MTDKEKDFIAALEEWFPKIIQQLKNADNISETSDIKIEYGMETRFDGGHVRHVPNGWTSIAVQIAWRNEIHD